MTKNKILLAFAICIMPYIVQAQSCDNPQSPEPVRIYFVNGLNNTFLSTAIVDGVLSEQDMIVSRQRLAALVGVNVASYGNSFNFKEDHYTQLKQVAQQRATQPTQYWQWMAQMLSPTGRFTTVPQWLYDASFNSNVNYAKELRAKLYFTDKDLQTMVAQYLLDLQSGKKVVLVAHSQGNFYANNAYIYIKGNYPQYTNSIGIVMVASPASINASAGPHTNNTVDSILNTVKQTYPILNQVVTYDRPNDALDHSFDSVYLAAWGQSHIKPQILSMINTLQAPTKNIDCATDAEIPVQIATWTATNITATSAQLNGYLTSGKNVYVWFNSQIGSSNVASCASTISVYPGGTGQANQYYLEKAFPSSANVYYRACAIGVGNRISEGAVVHFQTLATPPAPVATTRNISVCASWNTLANPFSNTGLYAYQAIGGSVNGVAFGSFGFNPSITSPQCRVAQVKRNFTNSFVFYLTNSHDNDISQLYRFFFYDEYGQYMNRSCTVGWTLQNRTSPTCQIAF